MATDVVVDTTMGTITIELYNKHAPKTCQNFSTLASRGYYNNILIHRIIPNFMIQTGDPTGTGRGGSSIFGEKFADEIHANLKHTGAGVLSMANAGPNTNGSQFFITLAPTPWLDGKHTIFGRVKSGLGVVKRMGLVKTGKEDRPVEEVRIRGARIVEEGGGNLKRSAEVKSMEFEAIQQGIPMSHWGCLKGTSLGDGACLLKRFAHTATIARGSYQRSLPELGEAMTGQMHGMRG